jgi:hypothetical protein
VKKRSASIPAVAAACLVLLTCAHAASENGGAAGPPSPRDAVYARETAAVQSERCALHHARFGGRRAQLIRVMRGSVPNYVVVEVGKRDPAMRSLRGTWLKAAYGDVEHVWLGEYVSAEAALAKAEGLCPVTRRCWPGETDCGPQGETLTAAQVFFGSWPPAVAPGM